MRISCLFLISLFLCCWKMYIWTERAASGDYWSIPIGVDISDYCKC